MIKVTKVSYKIGEKGAVVNRPIISQGDVLTNRIEFSVFDGTLPYELESTGLGVTFYFVNKDGQFMALTADTITTNKAYINVPQEIINLVGQIDIEVEITDGTRVLNVTGFSLSIEGSKRIAQGTFPLPEGVSVNWADILGKPLAFTSAPHTHVIDDIDGTWQIIRDELGIIDVTHYGAVGDGVTDDSEAIKLAIADVPLKGGTLYFPPLTYLHGDGIADPVNGTGNSYPEDPSNPMRPLMSSDVNLGRDIRFVFDGYDSLTVLGYGATIISNDGNGEVKNNSMFEFNNCTNLTVKGFVLNGRSHVRVPELNDYENGQGWNNRSNISVSGGDRVTIKDVISLYSMMDGFGIGGNEGDPITNLVLDTCVSDYAYRNGLTLSTCKHVRITNCSFMNTGQVYGIAPKIGVDIEADWGGTMNEAIVVETSYFEGNAIAGLAFAVGARNCHVDRCIFKGPNQQPVFSFDATRWGYNYIKNCHFIDTGLATNLQAVYVENNTFEAFPVAGAGESVSSQFFHLQGGDAHPEAWVHIKNNIFRVDLTQVDETALSMDLGRMWFGSRENVIFSGNMMINLYSGGSSGFYIINWSDWVTPPKIRFYDNVFVFTETRLLGQMNTDLMVSDYDPEATVNLMKNTQVAGYPLSVSSSLKRTYATAYANGNNYTKSQLLSNNTVYKFNPTKLAHINSSLQSHTTINVYYQNMRLELTYIGGFYQEPRLIFYENNEPKLGTPTEVTFYESGGSMYIDVNTYYASANVEVNFAGGNSYVEVLDDVNIFEELPDSSAISGLTPIPYTFTGKTIATTADTAGYQVDTGHNVFVTGLGVPAWYDGTGWVDVTGTTL